jgi:REP element-mobilizing transposase RayT
MSRLRRLVVSDRWFFITCRLLPRRRVLSRLEFATLAAAIDEPRTKQGFLLTAWVFLPDLWHAIFYPQRPLTISRVMEAIKDGATKRINRSRRKAGMLWQENPQRNANCAYLCATLLCPPKGKRGPNARVSKSCSPSGRFEVSHPTFTG